MKVLFVVDTIDFVEYFGILQISSILKSHKHDVFLTILDREDPFLAIKNISPGVIACSITTGNHVLYDSYNRRFKELFPDVFTIAGGPHPTFFPDFLELSSLDAICIGEGDKAFVELLDKMERGDNFFDASNIYFKRNQAVHTNPLSDLVDDLDSLPYVDRGLIYNKSEMGRFPVKSFMASRGCPYNCSYCFNHAYNTMYKGKGKIIRRRSVDNLLGEIKMVKKNYPLQFIRFFDDIFTYEADEWLEEFADKYKHEIGLPFFCQTRADLCKEEMVVLLGKAGCHSVGMAIEVGDSEIRQRVLNRMISDEAIIEAFNLFKRYGIHTYSENILGLPDSNRETEMKTLDINIKSNVTFAGISIFVPYPGTDIYRYCIEKGYFDGRTECIQPSFFSESLLTCFSKDEKRFQKRIAKLGFLIIRFPQLVKYLDFLTRIPSAVQFVIYYVMKAYTIKTKIYPFKASIIDKIQITAKGIFREKKRHGKYKQQCDMVRKMLDFIFTPFRVFLSHETVEKLGLTSLETERINAVHKYLKGRTIDIACGYNNRLAKTSRQVISLDIDYYPTINVQADSQKLPFKEESVDSIVILSSLDYIPDKIQALKECRKALKKDGKILLTSLNPLFCHVRWALAPWNKYSNPRRGGFWKKEIAGMFEKSNFKLVKHEKFVYGLNNLYVGEKID